MKVFREDFDEDFDREPWGYSHAFSIAEFSGHWLGDTKIAELLSARPLRPAARTGDGARRRENPRVGRGAPYFRSGDRFRPFSAFHALEVGQTAKNAAAGP